MQSAKLRGLLRQLVECYGVSGAEGRVADAVRSVLQGAGYGAERLQRDVVGNLTLRLGPDNEDPRRVFMAHMDEIGLRVVSIRHDGYCHVAPIGGMDPQLWEGTNVIVHTANGPVPGCIAPVSHHISYATVHGGGNRIKMSDLILDVGAKNAEGVAALGIGLLDTITWEKKLRDIGDDLVQGRSLDDRFGCAALAAAAIDLAGNEPGLPTLFAWTVQEEVGLKGAEALAKANPGVSEAIAVDSFTVGTGPRDVKTMQAATLGGGAVLRPWDSRMLVPEDTRRGILAKAERLGHKLQFGFMPGGNDSAPFIGSNTRIFCFSVALQYSHSQVERISISDLEALVSLLTDWTGSGLEL